MTRIAAILILALACCTAAQAQRTTRKGLVLARPKPAVEMADSAMAARIEGDSARACVRFSGFEKTLRSRRESVHATSMMANDTIAVLELEIEYLDTKGRQLHKRAVSIDCEIPPGQTRMLSFPSWDRQQVWHYRLSKPPRSGAQATPFDVKIAARAIMLR